MIRRFLSTLFVKPAVELTAEQKQQAYAAHRRAYASAAGREYPSPDSGPAKYDQGRKF